MASIIIVIETIVGLVKTIFYCLLIYLIFWFIEDDIVMPQDWAFYSILGG